MLLWPGNQGSNLKPRKNLFAGFDVLFCLYLISFFSRKYDAFLFIFLLKCRASLVAQLAKNLPAMQETPVQCLGREDPLEKG